MTDLRFQRLLSLAVAHEYYGGRCRDFDFILPDDTVRLLKQGRLIAKGIDGVLYVAFEGESGAPLVPLAGRTLRLGMRLRQNSLINVTALPFDPPTSVVDPRARIALYRNAAAAIALGAAEPVTLSGAILAYAVSDAARPLTVTLQDAGGAALDSRVLTAGDTSLHVAFDLAARVRDRYAVEEAAGGHATRVEYYIDPDLVREGAFAIVEIEIKSGFYTSPPAFEITYAAKQQTLKYYLVARNYSSAEFEQLTVADLGFSEEPRPKIQFSKVLPAAFTSADLPQDALGGSDVQVALFKSQAPVARRAKPRKKLQLSRNGGQPLVDHLPQPRVESATADLVIHLSKP
jgi:hypothetical protein